MGWNDRLPEDPYWPEQSDDRDSYENWHMYLESQLNEIEAGAGLSSQNVDPASIPQVPRKSAAAICRDFVIKLLGTHHGSQKEKQAKTKVEQ
jgi:hypothetical protein